MHVITRKLQFQFKSGRLKLESLNAKANQNEADVKLQLLLHIGRLRSVKIKCDFR